ncbi:predicted protein [Postia placenta Mad-698-R]|nr:predicted protein [Postia placenta Mad-698-R]
MLWLQIASQIGITVFTLIVQMQMSNNLYVPETVALFIDAAVPHLIYIAEEVALSFRSTQSSLSVAPNLHHLPPSLDTMTSKNIIIWTPTTSAVSIELQPPALVTPSVALLSVITPTSISVPVDARDSAIEYSSPDTIILPNDEIDPARHSCPAYLAFVYPDCHLRPVHIVAVSFALAMMWGIYVLVKFFKTRRYERTVTSHSGPQRYTQSNTVAKLAEIFYGGVSLRFGTSSLDRKGTSPIVSCTSADPVSSVLSHTEHISGIIDNSMAAHTEQYTTISASRGSSSSSVSSKSSRALPRIAPIPMTVSIARTMRACESYMRMCAKAVKMLEYQSAPQDLLQETLVKEREGLEAVVDIEVQRVKELQTRCQGRYARLMQAHAEIGLLQDDYCEQLETMKVTRARLDLERRKTKQVSEQLARERARLENEHALIEAARKRAEERVEIERGLLQATLEQKKLEDQRELLEKEHFRREAERVRQKAEHMHDQEVQAVQPRHLQDQEVQIYEEGPERRDVQARPEGLCEEGTQVDHAKDVHEQDVRTGPAAHLRSDEMRTVQEDYKAGLQCERDVQAVQEELPSEGHEHMDHDVEDGKHSATKGTNQESDEGGQPAGADSRSILPEDAQDPREEKPVKQVGQTGWFEQAIQPVQRDHAQQGASSYHGFTFSCAPLPQPTVSASSWLQVYKRDVEVFRSQVAAPDPDPASDDDDDDDDLPPLVDPPSLSCSAAAADLDHPSPPPAADDAAAETHVALAPMDLNPLQAQDAQRVQAEDGMNSGPNDQPQGHYAEPAGVPQCQGMYQPNLDNSVGSSVYQAMALQSWNSPSGATGPYDHQWSGESFLPAAATEQQFAAQIPVPSPQSAPKFEQGSFTVPSQYVSADAVNLGQSYHANTDTYQGFPFAAPMPGPSSWQNGQGTQGTYDLENLRRALGLPAEQTTAHVQSSAFSFESSSRYPLESSIPYSSDTSVRSDLRDTSTLSNPQPLHDQSSAEVSHSQEETVQVLTQPSTTEQLPPDRVPRSDQSASPNLATSADLVARSPPLPGPSVEEGFVTAPPIGGPSSSSEASAPVPHESSSAFTFAMSVQSDEHATPAATTPVPPEGVNLQAEESAQDSDDDDWSTTAADIEAFRLQVNAMRHRKSASARSGRQRGRKSKPSQVDDLIADLAGI